ncbi:MAG TPA: hypothetical protein VK153_03520 [Candidatus Paceibacterota bacterium]|nr:hypothetical protein [Candidatus Paceibacterota bacterium]
MHNLKKYLPSKRFTSIILIIIIAISLVFLIREITYLIKGNRDLSNSGNVVQTTPEEKTRKDSNNNGIADFEEYLWGLNPYKNGEENKEFILAKKKGLYESGQISSKENNPDNLTENEILSREFFATIVALQQGGELNQESLDSIGQAIGQKIEIVEIPNIYTKNMLTIKGDSQDANVQYFIDFMELVNKYEDKDIGSELTLISQGLGNNDPQALYAAMTVASAYRSFGKELIKIPVPEYISTVHLSLANNYEKTAQTIEGLTQTLEDPMIGMRSILSYKKYSDAIVSDIEKISKILQ